MTEAPAEAFAAGGEVFDLGYQGYEGERHGRWQARRAMWRDGVRTTLGLGRSVTKKVAPVIFIGLIWLPAVVVIIITGFISTFGGDVAEVEGPSFSEYYHWAFTFLLLFAAVIAPELLCPDRREGVITLYLVRPITSTDYVAARWLSFFSVMTFALWFPELLIFGWNALSARNPGDWAVDHWDEVPRFIAAGAVLAIVLTTFAMCASAFTTRRPYAAIATLAVFAISAAVGGIGAEAFTGDVGEWSTLINLPLTALSVSDWIFGVEGQGPLEDSAYIIWLTVLTLGAGALLWWRYRALGR
ncbi:MAG: ABC transporter permease subunit [Dehalococcoidia bacterium]